MRHIKSVLGNTVDFLDLYCETLVVHQSPSSHRAVSLATRAPAVGMSSNIDVSVDDAFARDAPDGETRETFGEKLQHLWEKQRQRWREFEWTRKHTKVSIIAFGAACGVTAVVLLWVFLGTIAGMGTLGGIVFALAGADVARVMRSSKGAFGDDFHEPDDDADDGTHASYGALDATATRA